MVRHCEKVQILHLTGMGKGLFHGTLAVGNIRMGMQLTEIEVPFTIHSAARFLRFRLLRFLIFRQGNGVRIEHGVQHNTANIHPVTDFNSSRYISYQLKTILILNQGHIVQSHALYPNAHCFPAFRQGRFLNRKFRCADFLKHFRFKSAAAAANRYLQKVSHCNPGSIRQGQADSAAVILQNHLVHRDEHHRTLNLRKILPVFQR